MKIPKADVRVTRIFEELTPTTRGVTSKKMFGQPAAFVNGNLFMGVFGENLFVRLSVSDRTVARTSAGFAPFEPMPGRAMKEYWVIPRSVVENRVEARQWVARSLTYALTLAAKRPKRTS